MWFARAGPVFFVLTRQSEGVAVLLLLCGHALSYVNVHNLADFFRCVRPVIYRSNVCVVFGVMAWPCRT